VRLAALLARSRRNGRAARAASVASLNLVTARRDVPHTVLLRAVEPFEDLSDKTHGPGLLCGAFNIWKAQDGLDLCGEQLWIERPAARPTNAQRCHLVG